MSYSKCSVAVVECCCEQTAVCISIRKHKCNNILSYTVCLLPFLRRVWVWVPPLPRPPVRRPSSKSVLCPSWEHVSPTLPVVDEHKLPRSQPLAWQTTVTLRTADSVGFRLGVQQQRRRWCSQTDQCCCAHCGVWAQLHRGGQLNAMNV